MMMMIISVMEALILLQIVYYGKICRVSTTNFFSFKIILYKAAVLNLWSADPWGSSTPTQGVHDCLGN
jgi:hypothetical protein